MRIAAAAAALATIVFANPAVACRGCVVTLNAVQQSLIHLGKTQSKAGVWTGGQGASALSALAYLGAGHTHRYGRYKNAVKCYMRIQLRGQQASGRFGKGVPIDEHALTTLAVCEGYRMTKSPLLKGASIRGVEYLLSHCATELAWASLDPEGHPPGSGILWAAAALRSAKMAGLKIEGLEGAMTTGRTLAGKELRAGSLHPSMMAAAFYFTGGDIKRDPAIGALVWSLLDKPRAAGAKMGAVEYWAATLLMFNRGGEDWSTWNKHIKKQLVESQLGKKDAALHGSWKPTRDDDLRLGRDGLTAVRTMTLELYYRYARVLK